VGGVQYIMMVACYSCYDDVLYILMKFWTLYACTYMRVYTQKYCGNQVQCSFVEGTARDELTLPNRAAQCYNAKTYSAPSKESTFCFLVQTLCITSKLH